jgi:hypothetical protein
MRLVRPLVEALGHARVPFARFRPDHRVGIELPAIDPHRAAEAAADLEGRLDDGVACEVRRDRFEKVIFRGGVAGRNAVYQLARLTIGTRPAVADA